MPNPKYRFSKQRTRNRRAHYYKPVTVTYIICSNCGAAVQYHRVCSECGYYKGRPAIVKEGNV